MSETKAAITRSYFTNITFRASPELPKNEFKTPEISLPTDRKHRSPLETRLLERGETLGFHADKPSVLGPKKAKEYYWAAGKAYEQALLLVATDNLNFRRTRERYLENAGYAFLKGGDIAKTKRLALAYEEEYHGLAQELLKDCGQ